jgi:hypothetical protein
MKKLVFISSILILLIIIPSCKVEESPAKELGPFKTISSNGYVTFKLVQGVANKVISTSIADASYNVSGGQLSVNAAGGSMTIAVNNLNLLWCNACSVENSGTLIMDTLNLYVHAGSVTLKDLQINKILQLNALNTGTYKLSGTAAFLNLSIVNATLFKGYGLITDSTYINTTNAFDAEVYATQVLNAFISSSGNVNYKGNPPIVRVTATGSGKAIKK